MSFNPNRNKLKKKKKKKKLEKFFTPVFGLSISQLKDQ